MHAIAGLSKVLLCVLCKRLRNVCRYFSFVSGAIQEVIEVALLTYFYLPWLWDQADAVAWYLAKHCSWFHHNEIWGELRICCSGGLRPYLTRLYGACLSSVVQGITLQVVGLTWAVWGQELSRSDNDMAAYLHSKLLLLLQWR